MNGMDRADINQPVTDEEEEAYYGDDDIYYDDDEDPIKLFSRSIDDTGDGMTTDDLSTNTQTDSLIQLDNNPDLDVMFIYLLANLGEEERLRSHVAKENIINRTDTRGKTALTYAKEMEDQKAIQILLALGAHENQSEPTDQNIEVDDSFIFHQLQCAALAENGVDIIRQLDYSIDIPNEEGETVLLILTREGNYGGVLNLLEAGARVDEKVLNVALSLGNPEIVELLCNFQDK